MTTVEEFIENTKQLIEVNYVEYLIENDVEDGPLPRMMYMRELIESCRVLLEVNADNPDDLSFVFYILCVKEARMEYLSALEADFASLLEFGD